MVQKKHLLFTAWCLLLLAGYGFLSHYSQVAGDPANARAAWPEQSRLPKTPGKPTLVLFAHPQCGCSAASLGELERLLPHARESIQFLVVFVKPAGTSPGWAEGRLKSQADSLPMVKTFIDDGERETDLFGAKTSGQTFLYDSKGRLAFSGGLTAARGHHGDNQGRDAVLSFLHEGHAVPNHTPVFGCALHRAARNIATEKL